MQNLMNNLAELLKGNTVYFSGKDLLKSKLVEDALKHDKALLTLLLSDKTIKEHFFIQIAEPGVLVFDEEKFMQFVNNTDFLPDSYTAFSAQIGLKNHQGRYFRETKDVVLAWPYKDCVLEGGQDKDDEKRDEIFYNEILAPDEIDRLLDPKVFTNFRRYTPEGIIENPQDLETEKDSFIIKGNNLLVISSLLERFRGKVDCIYIDPPYNTGSKNDTFCYNNSFKHSTWLTWMKNRLDISKALLSASGILVIAIDENEQARLGVLLSEMFVECEIHCITIVHNPRGIQGTNFSYTHEYAFFVIPKGVKTISDRIIPENEVEWSDLRNWGGESLRSDARNCFYSIKIDTSTGNIIGFGDVLDENIHPTSSNVLEGSVLEIYPIDLKGVERKWRYARQTVEGIQTMLRARKINNIWDIEIGKTFGKFKTVWIDKKYDANEYGTKLVKQLVPGCSFDFPKSLWNVFDCILAATGNKKDALILDFFAGSGTTGHAVIELNRLDGGSRRYLLCEQMNYIEDVTVERMRKVIGKRNKKDGSLVEELEFDAGGISNDVAWQGGGSFVYCELMEWNERFMRKIQDAKDDSELAAVYAEMKEAAFFRYDVDLAPFKSKDYEALSFDEKKHALALTLEKNHLYVNLTEMKDTDYKVNDADKRMNKKFYGFGDR